MTQLAASNAAPGVPLAACLPPEAQGALAQPAQGDSFVAYLIHEVRNLVHALRGSTSLMVSTTKPSDLARFACLLNLHTQSLESMLDHLLEGQRQQALHGSIHRRPVDAVEVLHRVVLEHHALAQHRGVSLVLTAHPPGVPLVMLADPHHVAQVLRNLVGNALKAMRGGAVRLAASAVDGRIRIAVEDDGPGLPAELTSAIFKPFESHKPGAPGVGLGLWISRRLARAMQGELLHDAQYKDGARFVLELERADLEALPTG